MTAAVVLAAGASRRLGHPKQTVVLGGEMLVKRAVRVAMEAGLSPVFVVLRPGAEFAGSVAAMGAVVVENELAEEGMAASIRLGIQVAERVKVTGAVVMVCDQPGVSAAHLRALCRDESLVTGSTYAGKVGVPAYFPAQNFPALMKLQGDSGARDLLRDAATVVDESLALDIDTQADIDKARTLFS